VTRKRPGDGLYTAHRMARAIPLLTLAVTRKRPGDGLYTAHRMARAIPLLTLAVTRKRPGDFSGDAQAALTSAFRYP
jgi:hypothetical protein